MTDFQKLMLKAKNKINSHKYYEASDIYEEAYTMASKKREKLESCQKLFELYVELGGLETFNVCQVLERLLALDEENREFLLNIHTCYKKPGYNGFWGGVKAFCNKSFQII